MGRYIAERALAGLFVYIAAEKTQIWHDPVARTTDLLKALFD